jgi:site-specific DNA-methyltransferase (adenine-specific)
MRPYYQHGGITLYHGDCGEIIPLLGSVDMVFTSPPYNLGTNTTGGQFPGKRMGHYDAMAPMGIKRGGMGKWSRAATAGGIANGYGEHTDDLPHPEYIQWQKHILGLCWDLLPSTGAIYYNHKPRVFNGDVITPLVYNPDLPLRQIVIWARAGGINFNPAFYVPTHEWILILSKPQFRLRDRGASGVGDVWYIPQEANNSHPAPFPLALPLRAIETTNAATILDPFSGSGTTLLAAKRLGRIGIGIELEESYCEATAKRLEQEVFDFTAAEPQPEQIDLLGVTA